MICPKCAQNSGNDWYQCEGSCPMPMSPHFKYKDPITPTSYFVIDEDTLVYTLDSDLKEDKRYQIIATKSKYRQNWDFVYVEDCTRLRVATLEDFEHFRVCPRGHIQEP